jgi:hypothetical protein
MLATPTGPRYLRELFAGIKGYTPLKGANLREAWLSRPLCVKRVCRSDSFTVGRHRTGLESERREGRLLAMGCLLKRTRERPQCDRKLEGATVTAARDPNRT